MAKMTGVQKAAEFKRLSETTHKILGTTTVPAAALRNVNTKKGTAEVHIDGQAYDAVLRGRGFKLTGDYTSI